MGITSKQFEYISALARDKAAIVLNPGKEYMVESRLEPISKSHGFESLGLMIDDMSRTRRFDETHKMVVEALTTNETFFFRDLHPFEAMEKTLVPEAMARRSNERRLDIWSGASSTGQEAYSVAMMLMEKFPQLSSWKVRIMGTDLCSSAVEKAKRGVYSQMEVNRGLPLPLLVKYFSSVDGSWEIKPEIRKMVEFRKMNLIERWGPMPRFDLVLMRNVLIYFDLETRAKILGNIRGTMHQDGALFLGAAETTFNVDNNWKAEHHGRTNVYRIKSEGDSGSSLRA